MADAAGENGPRLPPRPLDSPVYRPFEVLTSGHGPLHAALDVRPDWPAFQSPRLASLVAFRRIALVARALALAWSALVVTESLRARTRVRDGRGGTTFDDHIVMAGLAVLLVLVVTGWLWSQRATANVHRLGGRLPSKVRCVTAWGLPLLWVTSVTLAMRELDRTDPVDVRPVLVVIVVVFSAWRPYALIRRILSSLTRVGSDGVIGAGYVLDLSTFGLLWWQIVTTPADPTSADLGKLDVTIGIVAAAGVGAAVNLGVWAVLLRDVDRAHSDRLLALKTRHDHRHLRLRGINPMDPEVRWALLRIRQQAKRSNAAPGSPGAASLPTVAPTSTAGPTRSRETLGTHIAHAPIESDTASVADHASHVHDSGEAHGRGPITSGSAPNTGSDASPGHGTSDNGEPLVAKIVNRDVVEQIISDLVSEIAASETSAKALSELADEVASETRSQFDSTDMRSLFREALDSGLRRIRLDDAIGLEPYGEVSGPTLLDRLGEYGITPNPEAPIPPPEHDISQPIERHIAARVYALEAARYTLVLGFLAVAACSAWLVTRSVSAGGSVDGPALDDLERVTNARALVFVTLCVALALVALWSTVVARHARRAGLTSVRTWRHGAVLTGAVLCGVVTTASVDGTDWWITALALGGCLAAALACIAMVVPIVGWFDQPKPKLLVWSGVLVLLVAAALLGEPDAQVADSSNLDSLTFFAATQAILACVTVVFTALATSDVEDALRRSPNAR